MVEDWKQLLLDTLSLEFSTRMSSSISKITKRLSLGGKKSSTTKSAQAQPATTSATTATTPSTATQSESAAPAITTQPNTTNSDSIIDYSINARSLQPPKDSLRKLYPQIESYDSGMLDVGDGHSISYQWSGNKDGSPGE